MVSLLLLITVFVGKSKDSIALKRGGFKTILFLSLKNGGDGVSGNGRIPRQPPANDQRQPRPHAGGEQLKRTQPQQVDV